MVLFHTELIFEACVHVTAICYIIDDLLKFFFILISVPRIIFASTVVSINYGDNAHDPQCHIDGNENECKLKGYNRYK